MSFLDIARNRCSVRSYLPKEVDKEILLQVLEAARIAPSASNAQPWHITVVQDAEIKINYLKLIQGLVCKSACNTGVQRRPRAVMEKS